jgi:tungstate transport system ATP-binding protein
MSTDPHARLRLREAELPIVFDDVHVAAGDAPLLRGVSLTLAAGAPTVFIGPNGSGKTTLLRAAMGLVQPTRGAILRAGRMHAQPAYCALLFQRPVMLRRSVIDNICFALANAKVPRKLHQHRAEELLSLVGLKSLAVRPAPRLSGGERQRLALARALASDPAVLFLDEPTASLDPAATLAIEELVRAISARGVKVVMATHDLGEAARLAGDIVLLHQGRIVESGSVQQVLTQPHTDVARRFVAGQLLV